MTELPLTPQQAAYLTELTAAVTHANQTLSAAIGMLCAGHGVTGSVTVGKIGGTAEAPTLQLTVA